MDVVLALLVFGVTIAVVFGCAYSLYKTDKRDKTFLGILPSARWAEAWSPLARIVDGTSKRRKMTGTHHGRPVHARVTVGQSSTDKGHYFNVTIHTQPGGTWWQIRYDYRAGLFDSGEPGWVVVTEDAALRERLQDAGIATELERLGGRRITYWERRGTLEYTESIDAALDLPSPERFRAHLDLLERAMGVDEVNPR